MQWGVNLNSVPCGCHASQHSIFIAALVCQLEFQMERQLWAISRDMLTSVYGGLHKHAKPLRHAHFWPSHTCRVGSLTVRIHSIMASRGLMMRRVLHNMKWCLSWLPLSMLEGCTIVVQTKWRSVVGICGDGICLFHKKILNKHVVQGGKKPIKSGEMVEREFEFHFVWEDDDSSIEG